MTVIIGIDYLEELLVIADTRVSYGDGSYHEKIGLNKLTIFGNKDKIAVLGFSGPVNAAHAVITHLKNNRMTTNYKRRFVIPCLKDDIKKWIQEVTARLPSDQLRGLQFLLCALEPLRRRPLLTDAGMGFTSFAERHMYVYTVRKSGEVDISERSTFAIIGSGKELGAKIFNHAAGIVNFGRGSPNFQVMRATVAGNITSMLFNDIDSKTVGGPFEVVRIVVPPAPSQHMYQWPKLEEGQIETIFEAGKTVIRNLLTGETFDLLPIQSWPSLGR